MSFKIEDKVIIKTREATEEDMESQLYYNFFGGLKGKIVKMPEEGNYVVEIDQTTLPVKILKRHREIEELEKKRWLSGLAEETKRNLTAEQKQYHLAYTLYVNEKDLELDNN